MMASEHGCSEWSGSVLPKLLWISLSLLRVNVTTAKPKRQDDRGERSFIGCRFGEQTERNVACVAHVFERRCESYLFAHVRWRKVTISVS